MLDGSSILPQGFHPIFHFLNVSGQGLAPHIPRNKAENAKYYLIDFGISTHFTDPNQPRLVTGPYCQDHSVPELSDSVPYDPFAVDVYIIGNVFKIHIIKVCNRSY